MAGQVQNGSHSPLLTPVCGMEDSTLWADFSHSLRLSLMSSIQQKAIYVGIKGKNT